MRNSSRTCAKKSRYSRGIASAALDRLLRSQLQRQAWNIKSRFRFRSSRGWLALRTIKHGMMSSLADTLSRQTLHGTVHIDPQSQSPLFRLPSEIRYDIWRLAVQAEDDLTRPFETDSTYYRPGQQCFKRIHTALLLTCRRVYLETHDLPLSQNVMTFWAYRGPKGEPAMAKDGGVYGLSPALLR